MSYTTTPRVHTARRPAKGRSCAYCGRPIEIGQRYVSWMYFDAGDAFHGRAHPACQALADEYYDLADVLDDERWATPDWLGEVAGDHPTREGLEAWARSALCDREAAAGVGIEELTDDEIEAAVAAVLAAWDASARRERGTARVRVVDVEIEGDDAAVAAALRGVLRG